MSDKQTNQQTDLANQWITKQAAIDALGDEPIVWGESELDDYDLGRKTMWNENKDALEALPPSQPERMRGKRMQIDSNNLIRKLPAMIQGRRRFDNIANGGNYHVGAVDDWCLTYKEVVQAIEDYCEYIETGKFRISAPINGSWDVLSAYPYKQDDAERRQDGQIN